LILDFTFEYNQSIELEKRASTDELTLLFNRRRINEVIKEQYEIFQRYQKTSSYIMLDIDYFKNINDLFGHQTGDEVLCEIANIIKSKIRSVDYAGRWGGEEFMIICPNTSLENAFQLAEKLRLSFMGMKNSTGAAVTASFGVGEIAQGESTDKLLKRIDDALYQAKENGRNQIIFAKSAPASEFMTHFQ
ncbi:MAG TPA: GGDEF domain-containing protein, partial [Psychromonas sp.]